MVICTFSQPGENKLVDAQGLTFVFVVFRLSFVLCGAKKSPTHMILVGNQKERATLGHGFLSLFFLFSW